MKHLNAIPLSIMAGSFVAVALSIFVAPNIIAEHKLPQQKTKLPKTISTDQFIRAVSSGNSAQVQEYIKQGGDVNVQDEHGHTALMEAVHLKKDLPIVNMLLRAKADVNKQNKLGWTALMFAARFGNADAVKLLITAGANINMKNNENKTALAIAQERVKAYRDFGTPKEGSEQIIKLLGGSK